MEPKKNNISQSEVARLGIVLPSVEERERFNTICKAESKTQPEMLMMLMDLYERQPASDKRVETIILPV